MSEAAKKILDDYELMQLIGDGAQGTVHKARKISGEGAGGPELYAVKVLRFSGDDQKKVARFEKSAMTLQQLSHPAIVAYHGNFTWHEGEWDEAHCLVMEFLDGLPLDEVIKKNPRGLPWLEVKPIFEACLEGLIFAKSKGIIHRDIKPSNIFVTKDGKVKLIDFDIARKEDDSQASTAGWRGTFDYMAPDFVQVDGFRGDEQSDIFSLGVCLFQALTGRLPYPPLGEGAHIGYLSRWHDVDNVKPMVDAGIFRALVNARTLMTSSTAATRAKRYKTFQQMLDGLRAVQFRKLEHKGVATYELIDWLGRGGFGEVYLGRRVSDGVKVAIKRLSAKGYSDRFVKEARIVQKYPHDALVRYVDFVEVVARDGDKQLFLVLEFLEGMPRFSLRHRIKEEGKLGPREAVRLFIHYLSGLQALHENSRPIIHRDIKPANLYAPPANPAGGRIFDLGIARDVGGAETAGPIPGTLDYMAPEFASAKEDRGSPQTDLYALGLCLYESLTGKSPFARLPAEIAKAWPEFTERSKQPATIDLTDEVFLATPALADVIRKALEHDPSRRYVKASVMKRDLEALLPSLPQEAASDSSDLKTLSFAEFVRGEDLPQDQEAATAGEVTAEVPVATGASQGGPQPQQAGGRKTGVIIAIAAVLVLGIGGFIFMKSSGSKTPTTTKTDDVPVVPADTAFRLDPKFASSSVSAAYVTSLEAEIARIQKGMEDGSLRGTAVKQALDDLRGQAAEMSRLFRGAFDAAVLARDYKSAAGLVAEWEKTQPSAATLGLTAAQHDSRTQDMRGVLGSHQLDDALANIRNSIPANAIADGAWAQAEAAAAKLAGVRAQEWNGVAGEDRDARIASVASALRSVVDIKISSISSLGDLTTLKSQAPSLAKEFGESFDRRNMTIAQADKGREQFQAEVNALLAKVPSDATTVADLARAEDVASKLKDFPARSWTGVSEAEMQAAASKIREVLLPSLATAVANMRNDALDQVRTAASPDAAKARLNEMVQRYPNASALVAGAQKKALADVDTAWKARPPPPPVTTPVTPAVTTTVVKMNPPVTPPVASKDPNEDRFIKAIQEGNKSFQVRGTATFDEGKANQLLASAGLIPLEVKATDLTASPKAAQDFNAAARTLWGDTEAFKGDFGKQVQDNVWQIMHDRLAKTAEGTLKGAIASAPPSQQARVRREFIKLLSTVDMITGRVSSCPAQDPLRARVALYFEEGFFNDALLTEKVGADAMLEKQVAWIKDLFDKIRAKRGIKPASQ